MTANGDFHFDAVVSLVLYHPDVDEVEACLDDVLSSKRRIRVILIDNSSTPTVLRPRGEAAVKLVFTGDNIGYGRAHNRAIAMGRTQAPFHLIMNTDVKFFGDVIDEMIGFMEDHGEVGLSSPKIVYPDGRLQTACRLLPTPANTFGRGFLDNSRWTQNMNRRYELQDWNYDSVENIPSLPGCFMLVRSEVLEAVGGFDERFFLFAEDIDLSRRIYMMSECAFVPGSRIQHALRSRAQFSWRRHLHKAVNFVRYFNKWGWFKDVDRTQINSTTLRHVAR
jgi:GT2 family glycosyltransferase